MITAFFISLLLFSAAEHPRTLSWDDLLPEGEEPAAPPPDFDITDPVHEGNVGVQRGSSKTVAELDGLSVKLPGFMIPLDYTKKGKVKSFLLVPYYGACIHVPPPPPNQIVFVNSEDHPVTNKGLWDPVWATGKLTIKLQSSDLADAAYILRLTDIDPYEEE